MSLMATTRSRREITRLPHLAHAAFAELGENLIVGYRSSDRGPSPGVDPAAALMNVLLRWICAQYESGIAIGKAKERALANKVCCEPRLRVENTLREGPDA